MGLEFDKLVGEHFAEQHDYRSQELNLGVSRYKIHYFETLVDSALIQDYILKPLLLRPNDPIREVVSILDYAETDNPGEAVQAILGGKTVLQRSNGDKIYLLGTDLKKERSINIPTNERVLRGPNEAFIENLHTNINLMRNLIPSSELIVKMTTVGRISRTKVALLYIKSIADSTFVKEIESRLRSIDIDYVEAPGFIDELIREKKFSLFPQQLVTERPDRARAHLMEGKIVLLTSGSPDSLILPVTFWSFLQSPDDYQISWLLGTIFRLLRLCCFFITLGLPGLYVSVCSFNPQLLPINFVNTLQSSMKYIAFPPLLEALFMMLLLEVVREATVRLANPIGQTIGIVGGIVIGTVVVQSNLVSNAMVIIVALTGVASFIIPSYEMSSAARLLSYPALLISSLLGLLGLAFFFMMIVIHLCKASTLGVAYYAPPFTAQAAKDTLIRAPMWKQRERPRDTAPSNRTRQRNPRGWRR
ncbi:spore germination protein [Cohnella sp. AR92]|nr:spore germination protein [Cohnella sp. AR92]